MSQPLTLQEKSVKQITLFSLGISFLLVLTLLLMPEPKYHEPTAEQLIKKNQISQINEKIRAQQVYRGWNPYQAKKARIVLKKQKTLSKSTVPSYQLAYVD